MTRFITLAIAEHDYFLKLTHAHFPIEPVPQAFFWPQCSDRIHGDIPQELRHRIAHHRWPEIRLVGWLMIGAAPCIARAHRAPSTFNYYLPSLLVGVFDDLGYLDWILEGLLPFNKTHTPRGMWWAEFVASVSDPQRSAIRVFLAVVRSSNPSDLRDQALLADAEAIWGL